LSSGKCGLERRADGPTVLAGDEARRTADHMDDAQLHDRLLEDRIGGPGERRPDPLVGARPSPREPTLASAR
jgi:hypothetical protein